MTASCGFILPDRIHYEWRPTACTDCAEDAIPDAMVGLALSGGGSRAAVFSAAVIEALAEQGLAERITHISSVSAGGFAASYFLTHPLPSACTGRSQAAEQCRQTYFSAFESAMRDDFATALIFNQIASPGRITSPTRRATSLQEALDARFLHGTTFADLPASPILLLNAASYDDGRRFVFSNTILNDDRAAYPPLSQEALRTSSFSRADCLQPTPADLPLSLAVVASAAFPPAFGPVTVQAARSCADPTVQYWHLGDGGIIDNTGTDTLRELVVQGAHEGRLHSALIFIADAGIRTDPEQSWADSDLSLFTSNPGAVVAVAQARGDAYAALFWQRVQESLDIPFDTIVFRYDETQLVDWPDSCTVERESGQTIARHIAAIPTALNISDCDADLLTAAANDLVHRRLAESTEVLRRHGLALVGGAVASAQ